MGSNLHILRGHKAEEWVHESPAELSPCPVCGAKAYVLHDIVDGYDMGWSVGCPRFKISDGIHGCDDYESAQAAKLRFLYLNSKQECIEIWNKRCKHPEVQVKTTEDT